MMYGDSCSHMLTVQYRMNTSIMQWSSDALYEVGSHEHHAVVHLMQWALTSITQCVLTSIMQWALW